MRFKAVIASILIFALLLMSCSAEEIMPEFRGMNDPDLLPYIEDTLYAELVSVLDSEEFFVENVSAIYISEEYLEELAFNSQSNIYFGYTLAELEAQFQGDRYVFTLGQDNETTVEPWEAYDDTYDRVIRNVAIGTGVILVCVTVSVVTAGAGAPAVSMIFAVAAKDGAIGALSGAALGSVSAGIVTGIQTGDMDEALKSAALAGSEGFKWGAISGTVEGIGRGLIQLGDTTFFKPGTPQARKYPNGVRFTETPNGTFPRFEQWAKATVTFDTPTREAALNHTGLSGNYYWDAKLANQICGFKNTPSGYVWHHVEDMRTLILVPQDLHSIAIGGMPHTGGASLIKAFLGLGS